MDERCRVHTSREPGEPGKDNGVYVCAVTTHAACVLVRVHTSREAETHDTISGAARSLIQQTRITRKFSDNH